MAKLAEDILDPGNLSCDAIVHGKTYEKIAISKFEDLHKVNVLPCGLFIHEEFPFLAATPDGLVGTSKIVEVKCPYAGRNSEMKANNEFPFLFMTEQNELHLKHNHNYMHQIQGQLAISKKKSCFFIVYTFKELFVEKIAYDETFFLQHILPKTKNFYENFYKPVIASKL
jgi:hypothetical protein